MGPDWMPLSGCFCLFIAGTKQLPMDTARHLIFLIFQPCWTLCNQHPCPTLRYVVIWVLDNLSFRRSLRAVFQSESSGYRLSSRNRDPTLGTVRVSATWCYPSPSQIDAAAFQVSSKPKQRARPRQRLEEGVAAPSAQRHVVSAVAAIGAESEYGNLKGFKADFRAEPGQMMARSTC